MKIKFMLVPLVVLGLIVVGCSDEKKVVEKKKEPIVDINSKWFTLTSNELTWKKAKQFCESNGGRLPTISELKEVIKDCEGVVVNYDDNDWDNLTNTNIANQFYQSCYKRKGFSSNTYYWSSTFVNDFRGYVWFVFFKDGDVNARDKDYNNYFRCIKDIE